MEPYRLEEQEAEPVDEAILAALDEADAEADRDGTYTLEEARIIAKERYQAWLKTQQEVLTG